MLILNLLLSLSLMASATEDFNDFNDDNFTYSHGSSGYSGETTHSAPQTQPLQTNRPTWQPAPGSIKNAPSGQAINRGGCLAVASGEECEVFRLTNIERKRRGLPALTMSQQCHDAAKISSQEMARRRNIGHFMFNSLARSHNIRRENVAMGQTSASEVVTGWMNSSGHRKNILSRDIRSMGVSLVRGQGGWMTRGLYWTQCFQ